MSGLVVLSKFVGTISLGLLTGMSYTLSTHLTPTLLLLPSASKAYTSFSHLRHSAEVHIRALTALAAGSLGLAYVLSESRVRHPYLLWTAGVVLVAGGVDVWGTSGKAGALEGRLGGEGRWEDLGGEGKVNGEVAREEMEGFGRRSGVVAGLAGGAFGMAVLGIWGDGA
ncbi:MAG: hypothetical protein M1824_003038 [Vezdaea acicularis]|nr:MAG: hypothetical protein M1824_003038 [Vezdaea acicularis]